MTEPTHDSPPPGRPVRLVPTPPGLWMLVLGICLAGFAPLFGFLLGTMSGSNPGTAMNPLYWGLFAGFVLGALGVAVAVLGGWRLWSNHRGRDGEEESS